MKELTNEITTSFNRFKKRGTILHPSIPILYYGDYTKYKRSNPRVITVGLNPSYHEFPPESPYIRFQGVEDIDFSSNLNEKDFIKYLGTLNNYYKIEPYDWFESYDRILNGLNTSYYPNTVGNNAIHTNLCSPFATDQTWSKLKNSTQYTLSREGRKVWHRLVELLEPDMILCSIARKYLERISFKRTGWETFTSITDKKDGTPRNKPYDVEMTEVTIGQKKAYLIYGQAVQLPFGSLSLDTKYQMGKELSKLLS